MNLTKYHLVGAFYAIAVMSWGVLLWYHFDDAHAALFIPAIVLIVAGIIIEVCGDN
jgi:hypothetical protein